jgi:hypothetical protein
MGKSLIGRIAEKHKYATAWAMLGVMYLELAAPLAAHARMSIVVETRATALLIQPIVNAMHHRNASRVENLLVNTPQGLLQQSAMLQANLNKPLVGGPGQPEMSSFQSVNSANMVDPFTGDFSYNIPLMDVGGYPLNIHYNSGITMDQEASWVGLGWNINPGAINRNIRGLPDDFNGKDSITRTQNIRINRTIGATLAGDLEVLGNRVTVGAKLGVFKSNYLGWGVETAINANYNLASKSKGPLNGGIDIANNSQTGLSISPSLGVAMDRNDKAEKGNSTNFGISTQYHSRAGLGGLTIYARHNRPQSLFKIDEANFKTGMNVGITFAQPSFTPSISMPTTSRNYAFNGKYGFPAAGLYPNIYVAGYISTQEIAESDRIQKLPAFGYLYFESSNNNERALLDVNREKELQYNFQSTPHIAIPQYTYDVYSISGEGTGGTIRPYRGDVGAVRDHLLSTKSNSGNLGVEFGKAFLFHGGLNFDNISSITQISGWTAQNDLKDKLQFRNADSNYQSVYFRNPGEKTTNTQAYYADIAGDSLIRVKLNADNIQQVKASSEFLTYANGRSASTLPVTQPIVKKERDKRSQVVSYLTAAEAASYGLDKKIVSYTENSLPSWICGEVQDSIARIDGSIRKSHHLSEIDVLNPDGRRYIYGLPAYNIEQADLTFSVNKETSTSNIDSGLVQYDATDDSTANSKGKESYFNEEKIPAYAHSFLLTGILSPDYVDINNDGITEDDMGDGIKFNYSRVFGPDQGYFEWRTPGSLNKASYNEGFKTYSRDDKASYFFGKKEVWYVHSVESKTMIALFKLSGDRKDAVAAAGKDGGYNFSKPLRKLDRIELYSKSDLAKYGTRARPVKTVYFEYNYELCKGYFGNTTEGKLTLKKIWFSYNGNAKGKQNPYLFSYSATNPNYHPKKYDRWGNYKSGVQNPGGLNNADYPYAVQDSIIAAQNASAWHLSDIKLPSGGRMKVGYESDDYAFVQDRRATVMTAIEGFGSSSTQTPSTTLYGAMDYDYVFFQSAVPLANKQELYRKFLEGLSYIYLKIAVTMPTDKWGSGWEMVPVYGKLADYGLAGGSRFWIRLEKVNGISPLLRSAAQYLRNNLPSKAYPNSELDDEFNLGKAVSMLATVAGEVRNVVNGFEAESRKKGWVKKVDLTKSFARLDQPQYKKIGGGHRVKRIEIYDNWQRMTGQRESVYGQEYSYLTSIQQDGKSLVISSGVASYEPMIGNEENPFREPIPYAEKIAPMAPVSYLYSEMPLGESYFPGANVGYSKVRVRTINAKARSANGWQETEFFTTRDFPTRVEYTMLDGDAKKRYKPALTNLLRLNSVDRITVSQGFKVELNDMNGRVKMTASYPESDSLHPVSYTKNYYREITENGKRKLDNRVWVVDSLNGKVNTAGMVGTDIEMISDFRQQITTTTSQGIGPNLDAFMVGPFFIPIPSLFKIPQYDESQFRSAATLKLVQRYGILDSVEVMDKGSIVSTRNLVYDGETGEVVLSRTNNEFNDPIYNFSYPAHWAFSGMGPAYKNIDLKLSDKRILEGKMYNADGTEYNTEKFFESGDEIIVSGIEDITKISVSGDCPVFAANSQNQVSNRIWAFGLSKTRNGGKGMVFIDRNGKPYSALKVSLRVIRSGKRNFLDASVGSIMAMENPVKLVGGVPRIHFDNTTRVVNASVNSYSDLWRVDNSLFQKDSCYTKMDTAVLQNLVPVSSMLMRNYSKNATSQTITPSANLLNDPHFTASLHNFRNCNNVIEINCRRTRTYRTQSIVKYDYSSIPSTAKIISATLNLDAYQIKGIWQNNDGDRLNWDSYTKAQYLRGSSLSNRTNVASLKNVAVQWTVNTPFNSLSTGLASAQVTASPDGSCDNKTINVLNLVRESIASPQFRNGFVLQLSQTGHSNVAEELRTTSFYSGHGNVPAPDPKINTDPCATAVAPTLNITYSYAKDTCVKLCRYNIADSTTNPYRWGILGNWRMDRAYTYYNERNGSELPGNQTDIRKDGQIRDFSPYWSFTQTALKSTGDTSRWVWNSAMSNFNRKGFETENYDPLGRYNSGQYGYGQTLPVAVAQNSRSREILADGFEDYNYQTSNCITCQTPREFDFLKGNQGVALDSTQSHTGKYSVRVNAGSVSKTVLNVTTLAQDTASTFLTATMDSVPVYSGSYLVAGLGDGLVTGYSGYTNNTNCNINSFAIAVDYVSTEPQVNLNMSNTGPLPNWCAKQMSATWTGYIQPRYSDYYTFYMNANAYVYLSLNGQLLVNEILSGNEVASIQVYLQAGQLYPIQAFYQNGDENTAQASLSWSSQSYQSKELVPQSQFYTRTNQATGSLVPLVSGYCKSLRNIRGGNLLRVPVSPIQSRRMVLSGWVKINGADCLTAPVPNDPITVTFNRGAPATVTLVKTGVRIEGWQRFEAALNIPAASTQLTLNLTGSGGRSLLFDDVRLQPYNSSMKSFVYDPVSLRLMAELDENNYSTFYEYDDDGTLIRVKKETERGIMTLKETRSALIKDQQP